MGTNGQDLVDRLSMEDDIDIEFAPVELNLQAPEL
jgi:hypothetical protein